jgi:hypothetical protein
VRPELARAVISTDDPLEAIFKELATAYWSREVFSSYVERRALEDYLREQEHRVSEFERELWDVWRDLYRLLEKDSPRKHRVDQLLDTDQYTLVIFDGLSLREAPLIQTVMSDLGLVTETGFALSTVPSDTKYFTQQHFHAGGPAELEKGLGLLTSRFAFEYVKLEDWAADPAGKEPRQVIWATYPDNVFRLAPGTVSYPRVVGPIQTILQSILQAGPPLPLVVTGDHGYVWQGGNTAWQLDPQETQLLASQFKGTRCTDNATGDLARCPKCWLSGKLAAARGRFAWGARVKGAPVLYTHGGVSLMECIVPWITVSE